MACCLHGAWVFFPRHCTSGSRSTPFTLGDVYDEDETACHENQNWKASWFPFLGLHMTGYQFFFTLLCTLMFQILLMCVNSSWSSQVEPIGQAAVEAQLGEVKKEQ